MVVGKENVYKYCIFNDDHNDVMVMMMIMMKVMMIMMVMIRIMLIMLITMIIMKINNHYHGSIR